MNLKLSTTSAIILFSAVALILATEIYVVAINKKIGEIRQELDKDSALYQAFLYSKESSGKVFRITRKDLREKQEIITALNDVISRFRFFELLLSFFVLVGICPQLVLRDLKFKSRFDLLKTSRVRHELVQISFKFIYASPQDGSELMLRCDNHQDAMVHNKEMFSLSDLDGIIFTPPGPLIMKFTDNGEMKLVFEEEPEELAIIYSQRLLTTLRIIDPLKTKGIKITLAGLPENIASLLAEYLNASIDLSKNAMQLEKMNEELLNYFIGPSEFLIGDLDVLRLRKSLKYDKKSDAIVLEKLATTVDKLDQTEERDFVRVFNEILKMHDFYAIVDADMYKPILPEEIKKILETARAVDKKLSGLEYLRLNVALLYAIYPLEIRKSPFTRMKQ